jgi:hypothetical protein
VPNPDPGATGHQNRPVGEGRKHMEFRKSTHSGNGGNCVEVATTDDGINGS